MKRNKNKYLDEYVYIRIPKSTKNIIKEKARFEGSNMTILIRQALMKLTGEIQ